MIKCNNPFCYINTDLGCAINMKTLADCEAYQLFIQHSKVNQIEPQVKSKIAEEKRICPKATQCANTPGGLKCPDNVTCPLM